MLRHAGSIMFRFHLTMTQSRCTFGPHHHYHFDVRSILHVSSPRYCCFVFRTTPAVLWFPGRMLSSLMPRYLPRPQSQCRNDDERSRFSRLRDSRASLPRDTHGLRIIVSFKIGVLTNRQIGVIPSTTNIPTAFNRADLGVLRLRDWMLF